MLFKKNIQATSQKTTVTKTITKTKKTIFCNENQVFFENMISVAKIGASSKAGAFL